MNEELANDPNYQAFVAEAAKHCHCDPFFGVCAGVLAGGFCDDMQLDDYDEFDEDD